MAADTHHIPAQYLSQRGFFMLFTTKKPGDVVVLNMGDIQVRLFIFRPRKRKGRFLIGIQAPKTVMIRAEKFPLPEESQAAS
jgi:hypothetical protein